MSINMVGTPEYGDSVEIVTADYTDVALFLDMDEDQVVVRTASFSLHAETVSIPAGEILQIRVVHKFQPSPVVYGPGSILSGDAIR